MQRQSCHFLRRPPHSIFQFRDTSSVIASTISRFGHVMQKDERECFGRNSSATEAPWRTNPVFATTRRSPPGSHPHAPAALREFKRNRAAPRGAREDSANRLPFLGERPVAHRDKDQVDEPRREQLRVTDLMAA